MAITISKKAFLLFVCTLVPIFSWADANGKTGSCTWSYSESSKTLTISGTGNMGNYVHDVTDDSWGINYPSWFKYDIASIIINSGVTSIGSGSFAECKNLVSVSIPSTVRSIRDLAFQGCESLETICIPSSVTSIGNYVFESCYKLREVEINGNITSIGYSTFEGCPCLVNITIPNSVTEIKKRAFNYSGLTSIIIPDNVQSIGEGAFHGCNNLLSVTIGKNVSSIDEYAFADCNSLSLVHIPNLEMWCNNAFKDRPGANGYRLFIDEEEITNLVIPDDITDIRRCAFEFCGSIKSVTIPGTLKSISDASFRHCSNLMTVNIMDGVSCIGSSSFYGCKNLSDVVIPNSVMSICSDAFGDCESLAEVRSFIENPFNINEWDFGIYDDETLRMYSKAILYIPYGTKEKYISAKGWTVFKEIVEMNPTSSTIHFADSNVKALCVDNWDTNCDGELDIDEAAAVTDLKHVFSEKSIASFDELQYFTNLTTIGEEAFFCCGDLKSVVLPSSLTKIGERAFSGCCSLDSIVIPDKVSVIENQTFEGCSKLTSVTLPETITRIGGGAFMECNSLESIHLPSSLTEMSDAFIRCVHLKSIYIPKAVRYASAFVGCSSLESIVVDDDNPYLDSRNNCNAIIETATNKLIAGCVSTIIPNDVVAIGQMAFAGMESISEVNVPDGVYDIGFDAFSGTQWFDSQPEGLVYAGKVAYRVKGQVTNGTDIVLREGTNGIAEYAFEDDNCQGPLSVTIPKSVVYISRYAFWQCWELKSLYLMHEEPLSIVDGITDTPERTTLYVPYGSKTAYEQAIYWKDFKEIIEMEHELEPEAYTDISQKENVIYIEPMEARTGTQTNVSLKMKNSVPIRGFQFDLYLPEGVTVVKSAKGKIQGTLSAGRLPDEDEHTLTFSEQPDGAVRLLCSSQYDETFTGNDGEIATLLVNIADDMAEGDYPIQLKAMKLTETDICKFYETALVQSKLTVVSYVIGDINGDKVVDVSDYTGVANHIHGKTPVGFYAKAADVDESGAIDVSDYTGIANIIHTGSIYGNNNHAPSKNLSPRRVNTDLSGYDNVIYISPFIAEIGSQAELSISMKNTAEIRGFQFDLYLPEGMTVAKSSKGRILGSLSADRLPDEDEHELTFSEQPDGAVRFLCSSQYDETFTGNNGEIATLQVNVDESVAEGDYPILLKAMKLTESDIRNFYTADEIATTVTLCYDPTTRIYGLASGGSSKDAEVYDLAGRKVAKVAKKGVYIVGGRKLLKR